MRSASQGLPWEAWVGKASLSVLECEALFEYLLANVQWCVEALHDSPHEPTHVPQLDRHVHDHVIPLALVHGKALAEGGVVCGLAHVKLLVAMLRIHGNHRPGAVAGASWLLYRGVHCDAYARVSLVCALDYVARLSRDVVQFLEEDAIVRAWIQHDRTSAPGAPARDHACLDPAVSRVLAAHMKKAMPVSSTKRGVPDMSAELAMKDTPMAEWESRFRPAHPVHGKDHVVEGAEAVVSRLERLMQEHVQPDTLYDDAWFTDFGSAALEWWWGYAMTKMPGARAYVAVRFVRLLMDRVRKKESVDGPMMSVVGADVPGAHTSLGFASETGPGARPSTSSLSRHKTGGGSSHASARGGGGGGGGGSRGGSHRGRSGGGGGGGGGGGDGGGGRGYRRGGGRRVKTRWSIKVPPSALSREHVVALFPQEQVAFYHLLHVVDNHAFNALVARVLCTFLAKLDAEPPSRDEDAIPKHVARLRVLGRFWGYVVFSPFWGAYGSSEDARAAGVKWVDHDDVHSMPSFPCLRHWLDRASRSNRLCLTVPWVLAFLRLALPGPCLSRSAYIRQQVAHLYAVFRLRGNPWLESPVGAFLRAEVDHFCLDWSRAHASTTVSGAHEVYCTLVGPRLAQHLLHRELGALAGVSSTVHHAVLSLVPQPVLEKDARDVGRDSCDARAANWIQSRLWGMPLWRSQLKALVHRELSATKAPRRVHVSTTLGAWTQPAWLHGVEQARVSSQIQCMTKAFFVRHAELELVVSLVLQSVDGLCRRAMEVERVRIPVRFREAVASRGGDCDPDEKAVVQAKVDCAVTTLTACMYRVKKNVLASVPPILKLVRGDDPFPVLVHQETGAPQLTLVDMFWYRVEGKTRQWFRSTIPVLLDGLVADIVPSPVVVVSAAFALPPKETNTEPIVVAKHPLQWQLDLVHMIGVLEASVKGDRHEGDEWIVSVSQPLASSASGKGAPDGMVAIFLSKFRDHSLSATQCGAVEAVLRCWMRNAWVTVQSVEWEAEAWLRSGAEEGEVGDPMHTMWRNLGTWWHQTHPHSMFLARWWWEARGKG